MATQERSEKIGRPVRPEPTGRATGSKPGSGALTDAKIMALKPPATGQVEYPDTIVPGLRVRIGVSGAKTFVLRKRVAGKNRNITLGRYSERLTLPEARKKARQILSDVEMKADPVAALPKPQKRSATGYTVNALWPAYKQSKAELRKIGEIERVFKRHILPEFGDRAADGITRSEITRFIDDVAQRTPVMARNILAYFSAFYTWALPRLDRLPGNPCRDAGRPPKPKPRERVLSDEEIGALWHVLEAEGAPFGPAIQLLLLTGQRRNEVFEAEGAEFDLERALWTIPGERAKNGVAHLVPCAPAVVSIIESLLDHDRGDKLLPARGNWEVGPSGFSKAMARIRAALEKQVGRPVPHWTLHDLRRTTATGLQRLGIRLEVTEAVLNHLSGARSGIVGVYQRHHYFDEKRAALAAWSKEVTRLQGLHRRKSRLQKV
ncbi:site-specific integrase [Sphingomonas sp. LB-2]|uniref:tyrosine-type recombinase/integrase n=1 Tax=Sphingomonas caeni TaxID=2984949 RepID=UPI002231F9C9|nr:site-specific integrase [Sphingomonas caeni]MCW3848858.1 site-specific integrase [Sphingomonas caeni]